MPCYQSTNLPAGGSTTGRTAYATEQECLEACKEGACCQGTTCSVRPQCQCQGTGQTFHGVGTTCNPSPCCQDSAVAVLVTVSGYRDCLATGQRITAIPRSMTCMPGGGVISGVGGGVANFGYTHSFEAGSGLNYRGAFLQLLFSSSSLKFTVGYAEVTNDELLQCGPCGLYASVALYYQNPETHNCIGSIKNWDWIVGKSYTVVTNNRGGLGNCRSDTSNDTCTVTIDGVQYL
jgi:hypothetical protein